ncbi:lipid A biosynthesis acyltransferase [Panacibacter ginsenosidivorans]|uniref:Lipid A biosynthesis acyltransferase n=1 Tax=Panacibacter ginsenosidivorans TaxID=1813871 RepID=A0A5B8V8T2_9BACT|nr:lipid A biosynthesis acyltransferase [Panacibacter ginsenosidivorans]QEC67575.1 lipid A biosynthesis acyltransferase [Panacibacter ginsenosidivorans]
MYYIVFGFLYLLSLLPFGVLYIFSDAIYLLVYYVIKYRRDVVANNLLIAFPEKTVAERKKIEKDFYKGFIDNFIETIKLFSMSGDELNKRFVGNFEVVNDLHATGKKVQLHSGHFFNWEFANAGYSHNFIYPLITVYMPISNKILDRAFIYMRKRFGAILIPATDFSNSFLPYSKTQYCLALVGDQNPGGPDKAYWTKFFGKMTPIVKGPERTAKISDTAVVMCNFYKVKRGYYKSDMVLLTTDARSLPHGEITRQMISFVEQSIRNNPSCYLWSHRRWKFEFDEEKFGKMVV